MLPVPEEKIVRKWRLQPGKMLLIDLEEGRIIGDDEIKQKLASEHPYEAWLKETQWKLEELPDPPEGAVPAVPNDPSTRLDLQQAFGYTTEDIQFFLEPMAQRGRRPGRLDGHRHADRRASRTGRSCSTTTSSRISRRSPTRRSTRSAKNW